MTTTTTPPDLVPEIDTVRVVGHTFRYCVNIPAHPIQAGHGTDRLTVAECGAAIVHRMLATALTGRAIGLRWSGGPGTPARAGWLAPLAAPAAVPGHARHAWDMRWLPPDPDGKKLAEALRVGASREFDRLTGAPADLGGLKWEPLALSRYDPGAADADAKTAVYACVDASAPPERPDDLVRGTPGLILLHLTASRRVEPGKKARLEAALRGLVRHPRVVVVVGDRALNHLGLPITDDNSWEAFADALMGSKQWSLYDALRKDFTNAHLIVRHKAYGAVRIDHRGPDDRDRKRFLHYVLDAGHSLPAPSGFLRGHNAVLGASILAHLVARPEPDQAFGDALADGVAAGLRRCIAFEAKGFFGAGAADLLAPAELFDGAGKPDPGFAWLPIPSHDSPIRLSRKWSLLDVIVQRPPCPQPTRRAGRRRLTSPTPTQPPTRPGPPPTTSTGRGRARSASASS